VGDSNARRLRSPGQRLRRRSALGNQGHQRHWNESILESHGRHLALGRLGRLVRPGSTPQQNYTSLGMRIPMVLISPYAIPHNISKTQYDYGSILRFIEETFNLGSLGTTDSSANSLSDSFDVKQMPNTFKAAPIPPASSCANAAMPKGMVERIIEHDGGVPE